MRVSMLCPAGAHARLAHQTGKGMVRRDGAGDDAAGGLLYWSTGSARATSRRHQSNFSDLNRPHDRYERAPTRGRPSAGCWGNRWQTRRLNSLNRQASRSPSSSERIMIWHSPSGRRTHVGLRIKRA